MSSNIFAANVYYAGNVIVSQSLNVGSITSTVVASGQVQSLDSVRAHALPSDAMIVASATQVNPANQNTGSYAIVESSGGSSFVVNGSVPATTLSPFADLYKEGSLYFPGVNTSNITYNSTSSFNFASSLTAEAWVNYQTFAGSTVTILAQTVPCLVGAFTPTNTVNTAWAFGVNTSGQVCLYYYAGAAYAFASTQALTTNNWNHVAMSITSGGAINLYINGTSVASGTVQGGGTTTAGYLGAGSLGTAYTTGYVADIRVVSGAALYTGSTFTVPSAPLGNPSSGVQQMLIRAGQNSPTIQNGALTFDRGLKQFQNYGPQTFNIVTQGFTAIWRGQFTGSVGSFDRIFEFGSGAINGSTSGTISLLRVSTDNRVYFTGYPTNSGTAAFNAYGPAGTTQQNVTYIIAARYNPSTSLADLWINGVQVATSSCTPATLVADRITTFTYLCRASDTGAYASQSMNTFAIYNRPLSNVEIYNSYLALTTTPATPLQKTLEIGDINGTPALSVSGDGKVSVQSIGLSSNVLPWPPAAMTGYDTVINGGVYKARASSEYSSAYLAWYAFDKGNNSWITALVYNATTGVYTGSVTTTDVNGTVYPGEWLQVQIPSSVTLSSYSLTGGGTPTNPRVWAVLGSRDGINWFLVDSRNIGVGSFTGSSTLTYQVSGSQGFTFFRWVVIATSAGSYLQLTEWTLYGTADTSPALTIAPATTFNTSVATPSLTGIAGDRFVPQDFSSSGLNIPAYVVSNTATTANTVAYSSFGPFAGEGSLYFGYPATTTLNQCGAYVNFGPSTAPNFTPVGTPMTIEGWMYIAAPNDATYYQFMVHGSPNSGAGSAYDLNSFVNSGGFYFGLGSGISPTSAAASGIVYNAWNHVSGCWNGTNTLYASVNGAVVSQAVTGTPGFNSTYSFLIGAQGGAYNMRGYIACARVVRGAALYTTSFTPPTAPLQPIQGVTQAGLPYGTVLLLRNAPAPGRVLTSKFGGANSTSVLPFPPAAVTTYAITLNSGYGQGTYVVSASSELNSSNQSWYAFDQNSGTLWGSFGTVSTPYSVSTGIYAGSNVTVDVTGSSYSGEWVQIQIPSSIVLSSYSIQSRSDSGAASSPSTWVILGSRDGTNWFLVDRRGNITWSTSQTQTFSTSSAQAFTYFRCSTQIIQTGSSQTIVTIAQWTLNGTIEGPNVTADGRLGVGVSNPVQALEVAGSAVVAGTLSAGNPLMFRNALYNGDMRINQRGISTNWASPTAIGTSGTGQNYGLDRMNMARGSFATGGAMAQGTVATADLPYSQGIQYYLRLGRSSGNATADAVYFNQSLETRESLKFAGQTVTLSAYYRTGAGFSGTGLTMNFYYGTGTDQNAVTGLTNGVTLTSPVLSASNAWQRATYTVFIPQTTTQVSIYIPYTPSGTAGGFDYYDVTGVQLEKGTVATPFEVRPYATELALCQRYYQFSGASTGGGIAYLNYAISSVVKFPVVMRATPQFTLVSNALRNSSTGTNSILTTPTLAINQNGYSFLYEAAGAPGILPTLTVGMSYDYSYTVSAEL
jgi:hypothetical protein